MKAFEPGLLAKANRGILYVDEVNLLDDHLVDVLLDSAASGWNTVEREGISISHPARFILVGSGEQEGGGGKGLAGVNRLGWGSSWLVWRAGGVSSWTVLSLRALPFSCMLVGRRVGCHRAC